MNNNCTLCGRETDDLHDTMPCCIVCFHNRSVKEYHTKLEEWKKGNRTPPEIKKYPLEDYMGDGVYALWDGYGIWLHANDHLSPTDKIYLEPSVFEALIRFREKTKLK